MKLYKTLLGTIAEHGGKFHHLGAIDWDVLINREDLHDHLVERAARTTPTRTAQESIGTGLLSPMGTQEVWCAGVTYLRSRDARSDESRQSGGADFYTRAYESDRPELFFKANAHRVAPPGGGMRLRRDSQWDVPEPEFTLFITSSGRIAGYTVGNDLSSRSIESENPLYLPQAKTWDLSAALGPCLFVPEAPLAADTGIELSIVRGGTECFRGEARLSQMKRTFPDLVGWLTRECTFPNGVFLMTGTCIVPPDDFTLGPHDEIRITIPPIGTLINTICA